MQPMAWQAQPAPRKQRRASRRAGDAGQRVGSRGQPAEADQFQAQAEPAGLIAAHQPVTFEGHRQTMRRGARQAGCLLQLGQVGRAGGQGAQHGHAFVDDTDTAYTVHERECYLRK